jgi:hypothetical protein
MNCRTESERFCGWQGGLANAAAGHKISRLNAKAFC